jgi:cystathionine beta-lyase/cystathionine gamma-synthase
MAKKRPRKDAPRKGSKLRKVPPRKLPGFETRAVHAGEEPEDQFRAVIPPIYHTSTYRLEEVGKSHGYDYSRTGNPTRTMLERKLASLECAKYGLAFASGMAAVNAVLALLDSGDQVLCEENVYGGTHRLLSNIYPKFKVSLSWVDATDLEKVRRGFRENTKLLWIETPTNPLLKILDIEALARLAHEHNALLVVDNTFASPFLQRPVERGCDIVVHSTTKYIGGHSDFIGGAVVTNKDQVYLDMAYYQNAAGAVPSPSDCYLAARSLKTLALRMRQHCFNAKRIAEFLNGDTRIRKVYYPGLPGHSGYELAKSQMSDFGGMISFELDGDIEATKAFVTSLKYFALASSLGAVESLVAHPVTMTHTSLSLAERERIGIRDNLVRISVGVEDVTDLIEDLDLALTKVLGPSRSSR